MIAETGEKTISYFCWNMLRLQWAERFGNEIEIDGMYPEWDEGIVKLGVNWSATGIQDPASAAAFAAKLAEAADIAANHPVNGAKIVYGR